MQNPRTWGQPCPNPECSHYRLMHRGNISAISTLSDPERQTAHLPLQHVSASFSETRDPVFFDLRTPEEKVMMALKMLLVKVALSDIGFVLGVTEETVLEWLGELRRRPKRSIRTCCGTCPSPRCNSTRCGASSGANMPSRPLDGESPEGSEDGRQWVWISFAPSFVSSWRPS